MRLAKLTGTVEDQLEGRYEAHTVQAECSACSRVPCLLSDCTDGTARSEHVVETVYSNLGSVISGTFCLRRHGDGGKHRFSGSAGRCGSSHRACRVTCLGATRADPTRQAVRLADLTTRRRHDGRNTAGTTTGPFVITAAGTTAELDDGNGGRSTPGW